MTHYIGELNVKCRHCGALHFAAELPSDHEFSTCCHKGKIKLDKLPQYPEYLYNMLTNQHVMSKHFNENIRSYNGASSFGSFGEKNGRTIAKNRGTYCYAIHGQVYHSTSALYPNDPDIHKYAQLYVIDPEIALSKRLGHPANKG